jgi:hypothetical protein
MRPVGLRRQLRFAARRFRLGLLLGGVCVGGSAVVRLTLPAGSRQRLWAARPGGRNACLRNAPSTNFGHTAAATQTQRFRRVLGSGATRTRFDCGSRLSLHLILARPISPSASTCGSPVLTKRGPIPNTSETTFAWPASSPFCSSLLFGQRGRLVRHTGLGCPGNRGRSHGGPRPR